jgi:hypothetical protein
MGGLMQRLVLSTVLAAALLAVPPGCGRRAAPPAPKAKPAAKQSVPLPSWAPKNPSKEFLRAARMLKPVPEEAQAYLPVYLPAWELFGSLTDEQVKEFLTRKQTSEPVATMEKSEVDSLKSREQAQQVGGKLVWYYQFVIVKVPSFSPRQRAIFDSLRKAWQEAYRGKPHEDLLVMLYKMGAKEDLSNVAISFNVSGGHAVGLCIMVGGGWSTREWVAQI